MGLRLTESRGRAASPARIPKLQVAACRSERGVSRARPTCNFQPATSNGRTAGAAVWGVLLASLFSLTMGCQTRPPMGPADLSDPGWTIHQGQAIWRPGRTAPEIAGELLLARSQDGRSLVQFSKTPFPILTGQTTPTGWQIEFPPQHRSFARSGRPPARLIWLHLAGCLFGNVPPPRGWTVERGSSDVPQPRQPEPASNSSESHPVVLQFRCENKSTGETLEGFLTP